MSVDFSHSSFAGLPSKSSISFLFAINIWTQFSSDILSSHMVFKHQVQADCRLQTYYLGAMLLLGKYAFEDFNFLCDIWDAVAYI